MAGDEPVDGSGTVIEGVDSHWGRRRETAKVVFWLHETEERSCVLNGERGEGIGDGTGFWGAGEVRGGLEIDWDGSRQVVEARAGHGCAVRIVVGAVGVVCFHIPV